MLQQSGARDRSLALGPAHFRGKTITGRFLRVRCHGQLQFGTKTNVLENGILVCSPELVTFLARHWDPFWLHIIGP